MLNKYDLTVNVRLTLSRLINVIWVGYGIAYHPAYLNTQWWSDAAPYTFDSISYR